MLLACPSRAASAADDPRHYVIEAQDLASALRAFAVASGRDIVFASDLTTGRFAPRVDATLPDEDVIRLLLNGTGLTFEHTPSGGFVVRASRAADQRSNAPAAAREGVPINPPQLAVARAKPIAAADRNEVTDIGSILVTARRKEESLQEVPQAVIAITSREIRGFAVRQFADLERFVAGIQLGTNDISMRGVTFVANTGAFASTVAYYVNDAPINGPQLLSALFDVHQVEFLRGPQGTTRGLSAPSGAITYTTYRPDLGRFAGDAQVIVTSLRGRNLQAAIGVPLIRDKLAIRVAAVQDVSDGNGVRSVYSRAEPNTTTNAARVSLRFEPTDNLALNVMYEHLDTHSVSFGSALFGPGAPGGVNVNAPANFNGPPLGQNDYLNVSDQPAIGKMRFNMVTAQVDWTLAGHKLSYIGGVQDPKTADGSRGASDTGNVLPGYEPGGYSPARNPIRSHEFRVASMDRVAGVFDYVFGVFLLNNKTSTNFSTGGGFVYLPGAFGPPDAPTSSFNPRLVNPRYEQWNLIIAPKATNETSEYLNVTAHLGEKFEIAAGTRHLSYRATRSSGTTTGPGPYNPNGQLFTAVGGLTSALCAAQGGLFGATYANVCDVPIPIRPFTSIFTGSVKDSTWIYDASISYHVNSNLMVYAHSGSSWREGPFSPGIVNARNDALLTALTFHQPETSKSYEVGLKWSLPERRGWLNIDYYHQTFENLFFAAPTQVRYLADSGNGVSLVNYPFTASIPARVDGIEADASFDITSRWNISGNASWANGRVKNASVPCNDGNFDGIPDGIIPTLAAFQATGKAVMVCPFSGSTSSGPRWNANLRSEYRWSVADNVDAYVRALLNYQPPNPNANQSYTVPAYATLDLYLGLRGLNRHWDVMLYGKNIAGTHEIVSIGATEVQPVANLLSVFGSTGYTTIAFNPRREFGLTLRYTFGAR